MNFHRADIAAPHALNFPVAVWKSSTHHSEAGRQLCGETDEFSSVSPHTLSPHVRAERAPVLPGANELPVQVRLARNLRERAALMVPQALPQLESSGADQIVEADSDDVGFLYLIGSSHSSAGLMR